MQFGKRRFHGKSAVDLDAPWATCDRCGALHNLDRLRWQLQWAGATLQNKKLLVCPRCWDAPSQFLKNLNLPLDPPPIRNVRPEPYSVDEA